MALQGQVAGLVLPDGQSFGVTGADSTVAPHTDYRVRVDRTGANRITILNSGLYVVGWFVGVSSGLLSTSRARLTIGGSEVSFAVNDSTLADNLGGYATAMLNAGSFDMTVEYNSSSAAIAAQAGIAGLLLFRIV